MYYDDDSDNDAILSHLLTRKPNLYARYWRIHIKKASDTFVFVNSVVVFTWKAT